MSKIINTRIQHRYDLSNVWEETDSPNVKGNYIAQKGEIVVYGESDTTLSAKFKVGDGKLPVKDLKFIGNVLPTDIIFNFPSSNHTSDISYVFSGKIHYLQMSDIQNFDPEYMYLTGTTYNIEPGKYTAYVNLLTGKWIDGSTDPYPISWNILPPSVDFSEVFNTTFTYDKPKTFNNIIIPEGYFVKVSFDDESVTDNLFNISYSSRRELTLRFDNIYLKDEWPEYRRIIKGVSLHCVSNVFEVEIESINNYGTINIGTFLSQCSWADISNLATENNLLNYDINIGDVKKVQIRAGAVGSYNQGISFDRDVEYFAQVIHMTANNIVFQLGGKIFTKNGAIDVIEEYLDEESGLTAFVGNSTAITNNSIVMNTTATAKGGWKDANLRKLLGSTATTPQEAANNTFLYLLEDALKEQLSPMSVYTDNVGRFNSIFDSVTETTEYITLLSPYECGFSFDESVANTAEETYQETYSYYNLGGFHRRHSQIVIPGAEGTIPVGWWLRSPATAYKSTSTGYSTRWCIVNSSGQVSTCYANTGDLEGQGSYIGVSPIFCIAAKTGDVDT